MVVWLLLPSLALALVIGIGLSIIARADIASYHTFVGDLRPDTEPTELILPAGAALQTLLIRPGDLVEQGQTLALLDKDSMQRHLQSMNATLADAVVLRRCLQSAHGTSLATAAANEPGVIVASQDGHASPGPGEIECDAIIHTAEALRRGLRAKKSHYAEQAKVIERYLRFLTKERGTETRAEAQSRVQQAVAAELARNHLRLLVQAVDDERANLEQDLAEKMLERISELDAQILQHQDQIARLTRHIEMPRLLAPISGAVIRLRPTPKSVVNTETTQIAEIRADNQLGYAARFSAPIHMAEALTPGTAVTLSFLSGRLLAPKMQGEVSHLETGHHERVVVHIKLSAESVNLLDSPDAGIALRGRNTAAQISVRKSNFNALYALLDRAQSTFLISPNQGIGRPHSVGTAAASKSAATNHIVETQGDLTRVVEPAANPAEG